MSLAVLSIDLIAKVAQFEKDFGAMARTTEKQAQEMSAAIGGVATAIKGLAAGFSIGAFTTFVKDTIDALDRLNDLSQQTGITADALGGLGFAASQSGGNLESVVAAAGKLNKTLAEAAAGDQQAGEFFKALGLSAVDAAGKTKTVEVAMAEIADKFAGFADGPEKSALAMRAFGKAGADQIPLLNEGGAKLLENIDYYKRYSGVTIEVTKRADEFNDVLGKIKVISGALGVGITSELLDPMKALADEFLRVKENGDDFNLVATTLRITLETLAVLGANVGFVFGGVGREVAAAAAQLAALGRGDLEGFKTIAEEVRRDGERALEKLQAFEDKILKLRGGSVAGASDFGPGDTPGSTGGKPNAPRLPGGSSKSSNDLTEAQRQLKSYVDALQNRIDKEQQLTELQKAQNVLLELGVLGKIPQVRELILTMAEQADAIKESTDRLKAYSEALNKADELNVKYLDGLSKDNDAIVKTNETMRLALEEMGLQAEALDKLRIARLDAALAVERENLVMAQNIDGNEAEIAQIERRIRLKEIERGLVASTAVRRVEVEQQDADKKRQESISQSINDGIQDGFRRGKSASEVFIDELKAQWGKTILSPIIKPIADFGANIITSGLGALASAIGLPKFATGISYVPHDMAAIIHKGERVVTAQENKSYGQAQAAPVFQQQFIIGDVASKADVARAVRAGNQATIAAWNRRQAYGGAT